MEYRNFIIVHHYKLEDKKVSGIILHCRFLLSASCNNPIIYAATPCVGIVKYLHSFAPSYWSGET